MNVYHKGVTIIGSHLSYFILFQNKIPSLSCGIQADFSNLFHRHTPAEHSSNGEISTVSWITGSHHILSVKHLLDQFGNSQSSILLATSRSKWRKARHKEVKSRKRHHVDRQFAQVSVELTGEAKTCCDARHCR